MEGAGRAMSHFLQHTSAAFGLALILAGSPDPARAQDSIGRPSEGIRLVRPPALSSATNELAGTWELRLRTPDRLLVAEITLAHDTLVPCPLALRLRPTTDSGCLHGELPVEWSYVLRYAAGQRLHVVRLKDSVWAIVPGDGIISGISEAGDLSLGGVLQAASVVGHWTQALHPDSLRGTFTLRRSPHGQPPAPRAGPAAPSGAACGSGR